MKSVKKLLVVGGGTAGLICALILRQKLNISISLVHSKNIGIIGVGEGSTEHFKDFMEFVGIHQYDIIKHCDATYKGGILFQNWGVKDYLHNVGTPFNEKNAQYPFVYAKQIANNDPYLCLDLPWKSQHNRWFLDHPDEMPYNQFHFNTHKLNDFLINLAKLKGIEIIEDDISDVSLDEHGFIKSVTGNKSVYNHDFYIDATGFRRELIGKLGAKWNSYSKYLKMKSAIVFPTGDEDNYNLWTLAKAMDYGWMFKIPVWGRHGNGYIFDSDYIDADQAKQEVENVIGKEIDIGKKFDFDPGALDKVWIKNCCAVGLSGSFVEPLEATSIGTTIQQSFILMHKLINYDEKVINSYNKSFTDIMENLRDFIALHYMTKKQNSQFWKDISNIEIPDSLQNRLDIWKHKMPIDEDFSDMSDYILFKGNNHAVVMDGLDLFDRNSIKLEFESCHDYIKDAATEIINERKHFEKSIDTISHKKLIKTIRNF
jgi:tryptophan halogenase